MSILVDKVYIEKLKSIGKGRKAFKIQNVRIEKVKGPLTLGTLEGIEKLSEGESGWLVTAFESKGEQYLIEDNKLNKLYEKVEGNIYKRKEGKYITAFEMEEEFSVKVDWLDALLKGEVGDFLIEYGDNDYNIVNREIFLDSYIYVDNIEE